MLCSIRHAFRIYYNSCSYNRNSFLHRVTERLCHSPNVSGSSCEGASGIPSGARSDLVRLVGQHLIKDRDTTTVESYDLNTGLLDDPDTSKDVISD